MAKTISKGPFSKGSKVLIRTVSYFQVGEVVEVAQGFVRLKKASWVADTGRFAQAVATGEFSEVEPFAKNVYVAIASIIDVTEIPSLPTAQK